jgi:hypothetical protein
VAGVVTEATVVEVRVLLGTIVVLVTAGTIGDDVVNVTGDIGFEVVLVTAAGAGVVVVDGTAAAATVAARSEVSN